uniref:acyl carrier protein n=1 Tax=Sphingomonas populi TaxID=2484750 RepID=UPI0013EEDC02|nr:phosphopantetheine-binding protein [Sphingomonas populi]
MSNDPLARARHLIVQTLGAGISHRIEPDRKLIDDLGADSLDLIELQCAIEDLGADAPDSAFHRGMRVSDVAALIPGGIGA